MIFFFVKSNARGSGATPTTPPPDPGERVPPSFGGKKVFGIGDSIMSGAYADTYETSWLPQLVDAGNGIIENASVAGKSLQAVEGKTYFNLSDIVVQDGSYSHMILALSANDISQGAPTGYTWWLGKEALRAFVEYAINVRGWEPEQIVLATPYHFKASALSAAVYNYWYEDDYREMTKQIADEYGCILAEVKLAMESVTDPDSLIQDALHPYQSGHDVIADYYIDILDWRPYTLPAENPLIIKRPCLVTADTNDDFDEAGFTSSNTDIIYKANNPAQSFAPLRGTNAITAFEIGEQYVIVPKFRGSINRASVTMPDPETESTSGTSEAATYVTASGRSSIESAVATFISALKTANIWNRCFGFWILGDSFNASKYSLKNQSYGTLTEVGSGTYSSDGWTGNASAALRTNIDLAISNGNHTAFVSVKTNVQETAYDIGSATGGLQSNTELSFVLGHNTSEWNNVMGWTTDSWNAVAKFALNCYDNFFSGYRNGIAFNPMWYTGKPTTPGEVYIGNAKDLSVGSTKKLRTAGVFYFLTDYEIYLLSQAVEALETDIG